MENDFDPNCFRNPDLAGCQIPCLPQFSEGIIRSDPQPLVLKVKRALARPWNYYVKRHLKKALTFLQSLTPASRKEQAPPNPVQPDVSNALLPGDRVRVRSYEEIQATLNSWKELKGCAFLPYMRQYCGTEQRVLKPVERFLDERDYQVKKTRGLVLLENVICEGTPVFGRCDRACHLFWRVEWLEKIER